MAKINRCVVWTEQNPKICPLLFILCSVLWREKDAFIKILQIYVKNKVPSSNGINPSQGPPSFTLILSDFINTLTYSGKIGG